MCVCVCVGRGGSARVIGRKTEEEEEEGEYDSYSLPSYCHSTAVTLEYFWPAVDSLPPIALLCARLGPRFHIASRVITSASALLFKILLMQLWEEPSAPSLIPQPPRAR